MDVRFRKEQELWRKHRPNKIEPIIYVCVRAIEHWALPRFLKVRDKTDRSKLVKILDNVAHMHNPHTFKTCK